MSEISLLVSSFDKVKDILYIWHRQHEDKDLNFDVYYGLNFSDKNFLRENNSQSIKKIIFSETYSWSSSLKIWLNQINSDYILLLLDDHIIKKFESFHVEFIVNKMKEKNLNFCQLTFASNSLVNFLKNDNFFYGPLPKGKYSINLQPSIWEKKTLYSLLDNIDSAWDFEIESSSKFNKNNSPINGMFFLSKNLLFYEQYIERGKYYPKRFKEAINSDLQYLLKREKLDNIRRFKSFLGLVYKIIKEFFVSIKEIKKSKI